MLRSPTLTTLTQLNLRTDPCTLPSRGLLPMPTVTKEQVLKSLVGAAALVGAIYAVVNTIQTKVDALTISLNEHAKVTTSAITQRNVYETQSLALQRELLRVSKVNCLINARTEQARFECQGR